MTYRDDVRADRAEAFRRAAEAGISMEPERSKDGTDPRTLAYDALKLLNDPAPREDREQLQVDNPPAGAFNGANTIFQLTERVSGENIVLIWHDSAGNTQWVLRKGNANPPATHEFFFDRNNSNSVIVGDPPLASDGLVAVYKVAR